MNPALASTRETVGQTPNGLSSLRTHLGHRSAFLRQVNTPQLVAAIILLAISLYLLHLKFTHQGAIAVAASETTGTERSAPLFDRREMNADALKAQYVGKMYVRKGENPPANKPFVRHEDLPANVRVIFPFTMVTMDYRPNRLNIHVDDQGLIHDVRYG